MLITKPDKILQKKKKKEKKEKKKNCRPISLMNIDAKILNNTLTESNNTLK